MAEQKFKRFIVIVLDGVGIGAAPDAADYGDVGSNSIANTARAMGGLHMPNMQALGLGNICPVEGVPPAEHPAGAYGKMQPLSAGKDTIQGHWELMGIRLFKALPLFPHGFPDEILTEFIKQTGVPGILGNKAASGTEIIQELGDEHVHTGKPIVYTSADSVFQIASHEEVIPIQEQYRISEIARSILTGDYAVGRVITRPFLGPKDGKYYRTDRRKDYPLLPPPTMLDKLIASGREVDSVGKIDDIFAHRGITRGRHTLDNQEGLKTTIDFMRDDTEGMIFTNLIEFDMIYGHRNDVPGYARALELVDSYIPRIQEVAREGDCVIIAADHGVDPTTPSTDHSREFIPLLVFGPHVKHGVNLGIRTTFSDVAATIAEDFNLDPPEYGTSFLAEVN